jgi:metal-responsive CopG/Arc/MetJ family transcriptional regulator
MKVKTSVTLSGETLKEVDALAGEASRSEYIERVLRKHIRSERQAAQSRQEIERLNRIADGKDGLEKPDAFGYQQLSLEGDE